MRGVTVVYIPNTNKTVFQSTLPMRGVTAACVSRFADFTFQSTLPMRGVTRQRKKGKCLMRFQSTLPMRGVTIWSLSEIPGYHISIHTPHAGSDMATLEVPETWSDISIHTPHAGSDRNLMKEEWQNVYFNPHSPCGE